ncbi:cupin domain-containing protein [Hyphococcus lacteus]|uniref:Cupin domain-containing protein n=1 Tax=Hyphococcus lacteus TaxID=3143536 RepID=A0ABV3Z548_9PROT
MRQPLKKINLLKAFDQINEHWSPHIADCVNGQDIRLAKIEGAFDWHHHNGVEEAFFVFKGQFEMHFRDREKEWVIPMSEGDFLKVPANQEHKPVAEDECWILLIENAGTLNTGEEVTARSKQDLPMVDE